MTITTANTQRNRLAAAFLAWFMGGFGAHKFYLGQIGFGILYLVLFWTFIPVIVAFVEVFIFLTMSDEEFNRRYNPWMFEEGAAAHPTTKHSSYPPPPMPG